MKKIFQVYDTMVVTFINLFSTNYILTYFLVIYNKFHWSIVRWPHLSDTAFSKTAEKTFSSNIRQKKNNSLKQTCYASWFKLWQEHLKIVIKIAHTHTHKIPKPSFRFHSPACHLPHLQNFATHLSVHCLHHFLSLARLN